jgi:hypothetical protein
MAIFGEHGVPEAAVQVVRGYADSDYFAFVSRNRPGNRSSHWGLCLDARGQCCRGDQRARDQYAQHHSSHSELAHGASPCSFFAFPSTNAEFAQLRSFAAGFREDRFLCRITLIDVKHTKKYNGVQSD